MKTPIGPKGIALNFPNVSRCFEASRNSVCFWGYDRAIEVMFLVEVGALQKLNPTLSSVETDLLETFDAAREQIHAVANDVYMRSAKRANVYILGAVDF